MAVPSEEQVRLYLGGTFNTLAEYFNRKVVRSLPYSVSGGQKVTVNGGANYAVLGTDLPGGGISGNLAVGLGTTTVNGGVVAAGSAIIGVGSTLSLIQGGAYLNLVDIRDSLTNNELSVEVSGTRRKIWGLIQTSAADGSLITASTPTPNTQISFVYFDSLDGLTLTSISATPQDVEFQYNIIYALRYLPNFYKENSVVNKDVLDLSGSFDIIEANIACTTEYPATSIITISTGAGGSGGAGTVTFNSALTLPTTGVLFGSDARVNVYRNGVRLKKGVEVVWVSPTQFYLSSIIRVGEDISITAPLEY